MRTVLVLLTFAALAAAPTTSAHACVGDPATLEACADDGTTQVGPLAVPTVSVGVASGLACAHLPPLPEMPTPDVPVPTGVHASHCGAGFDSAVLTESVAGLP